METNAVYRKQIGCLAIGLKLVDFKREWSFLLKCNRNHILAIELYRKSIILPVLYNFSIMRENLSEMGNIFSVMALRELIERSESAPASRWGFCSEKKYSVRKYEAINRIAERQLTEGRGQH